LNITSEETWCKHVKRVLSELGFLEIWLNQGVVRKEAFLSILLTRIRDNHTQDFDTKCAQTPRLTVLTKLTENPCRISLYLKCSPAIRKALARLRLSSHSLCIETGRWTKPKSIPRNIRFCSLCEDLVEDEYHFLFVCPRYEHLRRLYIPTENGPMTTDDSLHRVLNSDNIILIRKIGIYVLKATKIRDAAVSV